MIDHEEIKNLVNEWDLREDIIEKDYIIGWVLWGICNNENLSNKWIFKGGTCLKKCYIETYRFSEDLDFTVIDNSPIELNELLNIFKEILVKVNEESGIDFNVREPVFKQRESQFSVEGRIYYKGPRNSPTPARIKLDLNSSEKVVRPTVLRQISHPYSDNLSAPAKIRCYSFEELFAEKIRAMGERSRPRDLYDIINLFRRNDINAEPEHIKSVLVEKCRAKGVQVPTLKSIKSSPFYDELRSEWENMLGHQLQILPPFQEFINELPKLYKWLNQEYKPKKLSSIPFDKNEDALWQPPATSWNWGIGIPLDSIRFAAVNHLCIEIEYRRQGYEGISYLLEPYSLRRTKQNNLILHAIKVETQEHKAFRIDWIESINVTNKSFIPKYKIEFSPSVQ